MHADMKKDYILQVFIGIVLSITTLQVRSQDLSQSLKGEIQFSGAFALYPMVVRWAEEFKKIHPDVKIDISAGGAGKGITDALAKVVDMGMVSREIYEQELEKGAFPIAVVKDAVIPTINTGNPMYAILKAKGLKQDAAIALWKGETKYWGEVVGTANKIPVHVYTRSDACGAAETWAAWLGMKQEDLEGTAVFGDPGVSSTVQRDKVGIGFNNIAYAYDQKSKRPFKNIAVMPLDINGNGKIDEEENFYDTIDLLMDAIASGVYPSPPARDLYLVTQGKPEKPEVKAFLEFILTKGQQYTTETGYVPLSSDQIQKELDKLK